MTSEQIHAAIRAAYPDADPLRDYTVRDDGSGPYLAQWNIAGPVPEGEGVPMTTPTEPAVLRWQRLSLEQIARAAALHCDSPETAAVIRAEAERARVLAERLRARRGRRRNRR